MPPKAAKDAPPLRMIVRSKEGIQFLAANQPGKFTQEVAVPNVDEDVAAVYSQYGSTLAFREKDGPVCVVNSDTAEIVHKIPEQKVMEIALSPKGTYLVTWRHVDRREPDTPTLRVYATKTGQEVAGFVQNKWPALHWNASESSVIRVMGKGLYTIAGDFSGEIQSQIEERFTTLSVSPVNETLVAMLLPYNQDDVKKNAVVKVVKGNQLDNEVLSQTLGKVDDADLMWNSTGAFLLVHAKTNVDETGRSYYGESLLVLFQIKGKQQWHIQLGQNEPLHDVQWAPNGQEFVAVYGEMPSNKVTLFSCAGNPLHHFPIAARNRCIWAPNGRFLLLAGFGGLAGDMEVWDRAKLGAATATSPTKPTTVGCVAKMTHKSVTSVSWSPDSRHLYTAVTFPRMRLDNRIAVWKHNGVLEDKFEYTELYQVMFRPMNAKVYGNRDPSPPPAGHTPQTIGKAASQVFRPSHGGNSAVAEALRSHKAQQAASGFASRASSSPAFKEGVGGFRADEPKKADYIPGLPPEMQKAQADARRRAAEKAKDQKTDKPSNDPLHWRDQAPVQQPKAPPAKPKAGGKGGKK